MDIQIRNETEKDFREVEELTREAFWNLYFPGCNEHYLVHKMRDHQDFIKEMDFVAVSGGKIVGNIMYTKAWLINEDGEEGEFPYGMLALELEKGAFEGHHWKFKYSDVFNIDEAEAESFDKGFKRKAKGYQYSQDVFSIAFRSHVR